MNTDQPAAVGTTTKTVRGTNRRRPPSAPRRKSACEGPRRRGEGPLPPSSARTAVAGATIAVTTAGMNQPDANAAAAGGDSPASSAMVRCTASAKRPRPAGRASVIVFQRRFAAARTVSVRRRSGSATRTREGTRAGRGGRAGGYTIALVAQSFRASRSTPSSTATRSSSSTPMASSSTAPGRSRSGDLIARLNLAGRRYFVVTNDASKRPSTAARRFQGFGLAIDEAHVLTSGCC